MQHLYLLQRLICLALLLFAGAPRAAAAPFMPGNFVVARVGDGTAPLNGAAAAVFLDEYTPAGVLVQSLELPTSVSGNNRILTASGNGTSELNLTRSADGHFLVLTGYSAVPGTPSVATSASNDVARVIGRVAANGGIDTRTSVGSAFSGTSIRAAASADGQSFYAVGGNSGVSYVPFGGVATSSLNSAPTNVRYLNMSDGNLYLSAAVSPYFGLSQVGTGLPTAPPQAVTLLPGFPGTAAGSSPYAFYFADLSAAVAGADVVYVADDRSTADGGIQKWSLVAGSWVLNGTVGGAAAAGLRGLAGTTSGGVVSLLASGSGGLFFVTDNAGYNAAPSTAALAAPVATAGAGTAFRGVAPAPVVPAPVVVAFTPASGPVGTAVTLTGTSFTGATAVTLNGAAVAGFTVVDDLTITFAVPAGATSGRLAVTTATGTGTSAGTFTVVAPAPTITSFTPTSGGPGTAVTVTGTNFTGATAVRIGSFNVPTFTVVSATSFTFVVPSGTGSVSGAIAVTTPGGTATSPTPFNLISAAAAGLALPGLAVFPIPATDRLTIQLPTSGAVTVALRDLAGRLVLGPAPLAADQLLRLPLALPAGVYLLEVRQGGVTAVRRVEKN